MTDPGHRYGRRGDPPPAPEPLPVAVWDSHCHLDIMGTPVGEVLAAGRAVGVERVVTIGVDLESSRYAAETAAAHDDVLAAVADEERALAGGGRVLLRPSGTEPLVRVMVEAPTTGDAEAVAQRLARVVARAGTR